MQTNQADPPSQAQQLADARTANDLLRGRLAESQAIINALREECDKLEQERDTLRAALASLCIDRDRAVQRWRDVCEERDAERNRALMAEAHLDTLIQLARDLVASMHGDGNGRCWCGAKEADRLRSFLDGFAREQRAGEDGVE